MESVEIMHNLFGGIYKGRKVLITGHTGFKGSWMALWLNQLGSEIAGYSLNIPTEPSHFKLLKINIKTQLADIRDIQKLKFFFSEFRPEIVFHLAAQSIVNESYKNPIFTYQTNIIGFLNVLEASRECASVKAIVNVTTDKVYENLEQERAYREQDVLGGHDIYSSSKACSEILTSSYRKSFFSDHSVLLSSARAGNVIGGGDWASDRLIPDLIRGISANQITEIRNPQSVRPWEHVLEPLSGYLLLGQKLLQGRSDFCEAWNFGPAEGQALNVNQVVNKLKGQWNKINYKINKELAVQFHEAGILKLDCSKAYRKLHWNSVWDIDKTINRTVIWYKNYLENNIVNSLADIREYINDARKMSLTWTN